MQLRMKYSVVLKEGTKLAGRTPVTFDKSVKKADRLENMQRITKQITGVYEHVQVNPESGGHIQLGDWRLDANNINALSIIPQRLTLLGWKEIK